MPTLKERSLETRNELLERLKDRCIDLDISHELSYYIETLEKHLLMTEERVYHLENCLALREMQHLEENLDIHAESCSIM